MNPNRFYGFLLMGAIMMASPLATAPAVHAQNGEDALRLTQRLPATGARMMGMAGASTAGFADYSALFSNPAGLGYFRSSSFSGSLNSFSTKDAAVYQVPGFSQGLDNNVSTTRLGHLGYVHRVPTRRGALVFGIAFTQTGTYERDLFFEGQNPNNSITDFFMPLANEFTLVEEDGDLYPEFSRPLSFIAFETFAIDLDQALVDANAPVPFLPAVTAGTVLQTGNVIEEGATNELSFGGAVEASKDLMIGLSVNIPIASYRYTQFFEEEDFQNDNDGNFGTTDFAGLLLTEHIESNMVGINLRAGASTKLASNIRVGFAMESPTYYTINEQFETILETEFDNGDAYSYGNRQGEDGGAGDFDYEITTPWRLSGGLAFTGGNVTLNADAEYVDWSQLELGSQTFSFTNANRDIRQRMQAVVNTRFGAEFDLGNFVVRGGFAFQPDPREALDAAVVRDRTFLSAGFGYRINNQFHFDFGWMQERFDDQFLPYAEVIDAPIVGEEVSRNQFAFGVSLMF